MENTLTIFVASLNEHWEMPDNLAVKWNEYEKGNAVGTHNADEIHMNWFNTLAPAEQARITRHKATD